MNEKYTWECLWQVHCGDCKVAQFVEEHGLDENQKENLMNLATGASFLHTRGMGAEELVELVQGVSANSAVADETLRVAVEGYLQWEDRNCRGNIRGILALLTRTGEI